MMFNLCTPWAPQKIGGRAKFFLTPLKLGAWSKLFLAIVPEKEYPELVLKFWGLPKKFTGGVKVSPNFVIFRLFRPFLQNGGRYQQSENRLLNCRHSFTRWKIVYFVPPRITWSQLENVNPLIWLPVFIQSDLPEGAIGGGIPIRRSSVEIIAIVLLCR